jgi:hypothetical protein
MFQIKQIVFLKLKFRLYIGNSRKRTTDKNDYFILTLK